MQASTTSHRPARRVAALALLVATLSLLTACLTPEQDTALKAMNKDRSAYKLRVLPTQADAQRKAQAWAEKLARENTLYHSKLSDGIRANWCSLGENVGYGPSIQAIETAYMNSPGHKANIVSTKWNGVGIGHARNGSRVFTVQVFIKTC
jgi:uncharacterized protein YkwD